MRRLSLPIVAVFAVALWVTPARGAEQDPHPRLIVVIAVDQLGADLLIRNQEAFSGGLRRLREEGFRFDEGWVDHAPTLSIPGHATIATGAYPRTHGFLASSFWQRIEDGHMGERFCFVDSHAKVVGGISERGQSSRYLRATGLADWVTAADPDARSLAIAAATGLAVLYGGSTTGGNPNAHVYWYEPESGRFVTSDFYRSALPDWLESFNREALPRYFERREWRLGVPERYRGLARQDAEPTEYDGVHVAFPHRLADQLSPGDDPDEKVRQWVFEDTPIQIEMLFDLARRGIDALELGNDAVTDFLAVPISVTDRIGHDFGPRSLEQLDVLVELDRQLELFFDFLDLRVGRGAWVLAVTGDHGGPTIPEWEVARGGVGRRLQRSEMTALLDRVEALVAGYDGREEELPGRIKSVLEASDFIERAMTPDELRGSGAADATLETYRHTYGNGGSSNFPLWGGPDYRDHHPASYGVIAELAPGVQLWTARSTHAGAHLYDRLVPILFLGDGIPAGISNAHARTVDVAPTLARLAGLTLPATVDGRPLDLTAP